MANEFPFSQTLLTILNNTKSGELSIKPIRCDEDLWYATVLCKMKPEQEDFVNPAGFSIGRAYLNPGDNLPCLIYIDNTPIGYIMFRKWFCSDATSWSMYLDADWQGKGYGKRAARLAVEILKQVYPNKPVRLAAESANQKAHRIYSDLGFVLLDEKDGDDLVFEFK